MSGQLSHSPAEIVRGLLVGLGHGITPTGSLDDAWPAFADEEPDNPTNCITVYETEGVSHAHLMHGGYHVENHGVQVKVRALTHPTAFVKAWAIAQAIDAANQIDVVIGASTYVVWNLMRTSFFRLGKEPNSNRRSYTINALAVIQDRAAL